MELTRQIDAYCERTSVAFWAEPLNAVTNAAFVAAGLWLLITLYRQGRLDGATVWLSGLMIAIGIGSFLFHTYATVWAAMADTGPIMLFILTYFAIAMRYLVGLTWPRSMLATLGFLAAMVALSWFFRITLAPIIGSSTSYLPALLGLVGVGFYLRRRGEGEDRGAGYGLLYAAGLFAVSLTFRILDEPLCGVWPYGTHFLWHLCNAGVLATLVATLVRHGGGRLPGGGGPAMTGANQPGEPP